LNLKLQESSDECETCISYEDFIEMVQIKNTPKNKSHYWEIKNDSRWQFNPDEEIIDEDEYSFSRRDFS